MRRLDWTNVWAGGGNRILDGCCLLDRHNNRCQNDRHQCHSSLWETRFGTHGKPPRKNRRRIARGAEMLSHSTSQQTLYFPNPKQASCQRTLLCGLALNFPKYSHHFLAVLVAVGGRIQIQE